ncbi:MAG: hypothetical protein SVM86_05005, partial [Candidatus Cloacimonadota bacterium]|nr:hypothetical protein [Candidatus Cloacimonadota bacterium]
RNRESARLHLLKKITDKKLMNELLFQLVQSAGVHQTAWLHPADLQIKSKLRKNCLCCSCYATSPHYPPQSVSPQ